MKTNTDLLHESYKPQAKRVQDSKEFKRALILIYGGLIAAVAAIAVIFFNGNFHFGGF